MRFSIRNSSCFLINANVFRIPSKNLSNSKCFRYFSDSIVGNVTYSGGQASFGQGGYYGSGGARIASSAAVFHPEALARQQDVIDLSNIMQEVFLLENQLRSYNGVVNSKTIELKSKIKKTISNPKVADLLKRLEIKGSPVWGLSTEERDLVRLAKQKYMSS